MSKFHSSWPQSQLLVTKLHSSTLYPEPGFLKLELGDAFSKLHPGSYFLAKTFLGEERAQFPSCPYMEYNIFNTDIDPGSDFMEPEPNFIDASPGSSFRKPGPGSSDDSSYVVFDI